MRNKIILTDIDEVLLDWRNAMSRHIIRNVDLHQQVIPPHFLDDKYYVGDADLAEHGLPLKSNIDHFNGGTHFSALHAHGDAGLVVPRLYRKGWKLIAISAAGEGGEIETRRTKNIMAVFGPIFDKVIIVPRDGSKKSYLEQYEGAVWVEDNYKNALDGADCGHKCFLLVDRRRPSVIDRRIKPVESWLEIAQSIEPGF